MAVQELGGRHPEIFYFSDVRFCGGRSIYVVVTIDNQNGMISISPDDWERRYHYEHFRIVGRCPDPEALSRYDDDNYESYDYSNFKEDDSCDSCQMSPCHCSDPDPG